MSSIKQKCADLQSGRLTAVSNTKEFLDRIEELNPIYNCVLHINPDAIADAKRVDEKLQNKTAGKLAGLCFIVKSCISVKGLITNCASKTLANYVATYDADVITRIKNEDGIILGMANMDEFACGASGETSAFGPTKNPVCTERVPGGSSSGSAASVAAQFCDIALGTDTGGSIRNPASHCGVVGIKPQYGRVSRYGLLDLSMSLDQIGPLSHDVYGCALVMEVISGYSENDPTTITDPVPRYTVASQDEFTVGVSSTFESLCTDKRIYSLVMDKISSFSTQDIPFSHVDLAIQTYYPLVYVEFYSGTRKYDGRRYGYKIEDTVGDEALRRILGGREISLAEHGGKYYRRALAVKKAIETEIRKAFEIVDVLVLPTTPILPHKLGESISVEAMYAYDAYTIPANLAGICAGVIPAGTIDGIPIGLQVFAASEDMLFSFLEKLHKGL